MKRRPAAVAALLGAAFFLISWFLWTDSRHFIDGGDVFFPIDQTLLLSKISSSWWPDQLGSIAYNISVIPLRAVFAALQWIGMSSIDIERLFLAAGYGISAGAMYLCSNEFWRGRSAPLIAAIWYPCGIAFCMAIPNENNVLGLAILPLLLFFALKSVSDIRYAVPFVLVTTLFGFIASNPPSAVLFPAIVAILWLVGAVGRRSPRYIIGAGAVLLLGAIISNLWWVVLARNALAANAVVAVGVNNLLWTLTRSNFISILEQTSYWGFGAGFDPWLSIGQWYLNHPIPHTALVLTPVLAFSVLYFPAGSIERRLKIAALVIICVIAVFLTKGVGPPFEGFSAWLYAHVPGMFLFREPVKFLFVLMFGIPLLAAAAYTEMLNTVTGVKRGVVAGLFIAVPIITGWSLLTGWAFSFEGTQARVQIPEYWQQAARFINAHDTDHARVLLLPEDGFYQTRYRWGLDGQDRIAETAIQAPIVRLRAQKYAYLENAYDERALSALDYALRRQDRDWLMNLFTKLSIKYVLVRGDLSVDGRILSLPEVRYDLRLLHARRVASFGPLDLYAVGDSPRIAAPVQILRSCASPEGEMQAAMRLPPTVMIIRSDTTACRRDRSSLQLVAERDAVQASAHSVVLVNRQNSSSTITLHRRGLMIPTRLRVADEYGGVVRSSPSVPTSFCGPWKFGRDAGGWFTSRCVSVGSAVYIHFVTPASFSRTSTLGASFQWLPDAQAVSIPIGLTLRVPVKARLGQVRFSGDGTAHTLAELRSLTASVRLEGVLGSAVMPSEQSIGYRVDLPLNHMTAGVFQQPAEFVFRLPSGRRISTFVKDDFPASYDVDTLFEQAYQSRPADERELRKASVVLESIVLPFASQSRDDDSALTITSPAHDTWSVTTLARAARVSGSVDSRTYVGLPTASIESTTGFGSTPWWTRMTINASNPGWIVMRQAYSDYWVVPHAVSHAVVDGYANGWYLKDPGRYTAFIGLWYTQLVLYFASGIGFLLLVVAVGLSYKRFNEAQ